MTTSDLSTHSTTSLLSNEEQFEDYGEGDDVDCAPSSPCPDDETRTNVYSDLGSSVSSRWPLGLEWRLGSRKSGRTNPASSPGGLVGRALSYVGSAPRAWGSRIPPLSSHLGEERMNQPGRLQARGGGVGGASLLSCFLEPQCEGFFHVAHT